jgi:alginate O-acetyltransferase complex protein AlgI
LLGKGILSGQGITAGFDQVQGWAGPDVWCLAVGYGLQIFFDFAGYSHLAIGAAQMLGFTVPENFARPFASTTPSIFWTRWHMSLSFWIRDYVFLPLVVLRREDWWRKFCLLIAMVLFGIWHKAAILFVLFGCYHGVLLILHRHVQQTERRFNWEPPAKAWAVLSWIVTMALVNLGWIWFRANSLVEARQMFEALVSPRSYGTHMLNGSLYLLVASLAAIYAIVLSVNDWVDRYAAGMAVGPISSAELATVLIRDRWIWIGPMWAIACVLVSLLIPHQSRGTNVFMYRMF